MSLESVYLRRAGKVILSSVGTESNYNFPVVATLDANLRKLGFALDNTLAKALLTASVADIKALHDRLVPELKEIKGVRAYRPMYPNFPQQVMDASDAELYLNAIMHYFGDAVGLRILPVYDAKARPKLNFDESKVTFLSLGTSKDALDVVNNILMQTAAFGEAERQDISSLSKGELRSALSVSSKPLPNSENRAWMSALVGIFNSRTAAKTATDLLRIACAKCDGDVSLAEPTRFKFSRPQRREIMIILSALVDDKGIDNVVEDMGRHEQAWKRLGESVHPGEFKAAQTRGAVQAFSMLRSGNYQTFNSKVEALLAQGDILGLVKILSTRPGDFARRLDAVMSRATTMREYGEVMSSFYDVSDKVSPTVLVQLQNALGHRNDGGPRVFFPKGNVAKMKAIRDERGGIPESEIRGLQDAAERGLLSQFSGRSPLGKVWIDPAIRGMAIPFGIRSGSKALRTMGRGSRLPMGRDTEITRLFIWWKDGSSRTDIDLSAVVLDEDYREVSKVWYGNLRGSGLTHSGDITSAPHGASEFVDIDIPRVVRDGGRYVLMSVFGYTQTPFCELPECFAGFMERRDHKSGEIYDPRTVTNRVDLTANSMNATPFIFDLKTREAIWVDLTQKIEGRSLYGRNVLSNADALTDTVEAMTKLSPPSLHQLMLAHATARGTVVLDREDADFVFAEDGDFSPFDTERVLAELL